MQVMPNAVPISNIKNKPTEVLDLVEKGPIILTTRGNGVAVVASISEWNKIATQLAERQFSQVEVEAIIEAYRRRDANRPTITIEEHKARMAERYGHVADKA